MMPSRRQRTRTRTAHTRTGLNDHRGLSVWELKRSYRRARKAAFTEAPQSPQTTPARSAHNALLELLGVADAEPWEYRDESPDWLEALHTNALTWIHQKGLGMLGGRVDFGAGSSSEPVAAGRPEHVTPESGEELTMRLEQHVLRMAGSECGHLPSAPPWSVKISELSAVFPARSEWACIGGIATTAGKSGREALALACVFAPFWIRPIRAWNGKATAGAEWIPSLLEHLFVRYPVPRFLYSNWQWPPLDKSWDACLDHKTYRWAGFREIRPKWICWLILMGQGASLAKAGQRFDWQIPQGFERCLFDVPEGTSGRDACMWAEVLRVGGSAAEARRFIQSGILIYRMDVTEPPFFTTYIPFWRNTVRWLARHRSEIARCQTMLLETEDVRGLLDRMPTDPLLDWAFHMYTENDGWRRRAFSWSGRKPARVFLAIRDYRRAIDAPALKLAWKPHGWDWEDQEDPHNIWSARELTTGQDLLDETRAMHHCAVLYTVRCAEGACAVVSLRRNGKRVLTLEVDPATGSLRQSRGACNRASTAVEDRIVRKWLSDIIRSTAASSCLSSGIPEPCP